MKKALIIGCNGQDGRLLYESLIAKDYQVTGVERPTSHRAAGDWRLSLDIGDAQAVFDLLKRVLPDEIYYLAAYHHSAENMPLQGDLDLFNRSFQVHVQSLVHVLEGMRLFARESRLFYAASSHIFGNAITEPQDEQTPFNPRCIYGITKTAGIHLCRFYRNHHRLFVSVGILYNHESSYRKPGFVSRKIISSAVNIKNGRQDKLVLGNLSAEVDWGYAPDYIEAFQKVLHAVVPDDFVVATGKKHSIRDFVEMTFGCLGLDWKRYVEEDRTIITKSGTTLVGNPQKLSLITGWKPSVDLLHMIQLLLKDEGVLIVN